MSHSTRFRSILATVALVTGAHFVSAQAITYSGISNIDLLITNIFGIQCQGVNNVQVTGNAAAIGRYDSGQGIGLNGGMMLSTGSASTYSMAPYTQLASWNIGSAGDADIINYGTLNGTGAVSYDAISVQFDFTPQVTDTIRFTYVFASEEYPEYSNSNFSDRFVFLVSENGVTPVNIARVPGTTTAVEINSINQTVNSQYYIDNSTAPSGAYFVFDGYTVPLEAKFYAQVGSTYHIKLVISDIADGLFDSAIFLDEQESYNTIGGALTVNNLPGEGLLEVFSYSGDTLLASPVQSIVVSGGAYVADSLPSGVYHVRFTPDPTVFPGAIPLYFATGSSWVDADPIGLPCYLNDADIDADTLNLSDGTGTIAGTIVIDTTFLKSITVPFEGAYVQLIEQGTHAVKAFAWTDVNGNYSLTGIPEGAFYILVDVPYIPQADTHLLTMTAGAAGTGFDYAIMTDGIYRNGEPSLGLTDLAVESFTLYPNPANEQVYVTVKGAQDQVLSVRTMNGQMLQQTTINAGMQTLVTKGWANGVYLLQIGNGMPRRLVVQH